MFTSNLTQVASETVVSPRAAAARDVLVLVSIAALAYGFIRYATATYGLGLSPDSVVYLYQAETIVSQRTLVGFNGAVPGQPPLYPFFLAALQLLTGVDVFIVLPVVNAILFGLIVYSSGRLFMSFCGLPLAAIGTFTIAAFPPLVEAAAMALSEPLFLLFEVWSLSLLQRYRTRRSKGWIALAIAVCACACLTRYIGVTLALTGAFVLFLWDSQSTLRARVGIAIVFMIGSLAPLAVWVGYVGLVLGPMTSSSPAVSVAGVIDLTASTIFGWFLPIKLYLYRPALIAIVASLSAAATIRVLNSQLRRSQELVSPPATLAIFLVTYIVVFDTIASHRAMDSVGNRLLLPTAIPMVGLIIAMCGRLSHSLGMTDAKRRKHAVVIGVLMLWSLFIPTRRTLAWLSEAHARGVAGYATSVWKDSETVDYLKRESLVWPSIYTNDPYAVYLFTRRPSLPLPVRGYYNSSDRGPSPEELVRRWPRDDGAVVVWFDGRAIGIPYTPQDLQRIASMSLVRKFSDGAIYVATQRRDGEELDGGRTS